jgi:hypothetical protein
MDGAAGRVLDLSARARPLETIVETNLVVQDDRRNADASRQRHRQPDRVLMLSGHAFVLVSVFCFVVIAYLKLQQSLGGKLLPHSLTWIDMAERENGTISLLLIAVIAAMLGKGLLLSAQADSATTIPYDDLDLVRQAVLEGKPEPIDQYVRLRALSGMSGNFTKLGVTGLPLTTVILTLIFSVISLLSVNGSSAAFLDLATLTLGAFIGSFVQGRVEQRRSGDSHKPNHRRRSDLIA